MPSQFDKERTEKKLNLLFEKFKTEADIPLVSEYRALFKKAVPFSRRSWMAAYLLMLLDQGQGNTGRFDRNRDRNSGPSRNSRPESPRNETPRSDTPRQSLPEEESRRLFISIGRNRRVFPREILGLINTNVSISRDDIGAIRILDNYSFVQVRSSVADAIIEALNGKPFRGRTLAVNYARARREDDSDENRDEDASVNTDEYGEAGIEDEVVENEVSRSLDEEDDQGDEEGV
ncbi:RNA-binding protein [Spirochaetia bacterium]|nr:RNA-binding protein [Spirochaetia bacterium]